jgi:hypothetical protein
LQSRARLPRRATGCLEKTLGDRWTVCLIYLECLDQAPSVRRRSCCFLLIPADIFYPQTNAYRYRSSKTSKPLREAETKQRSATAPSNVSAFPAENHNDHYLAEVESGFLDDIKWHLQIGCYNNSALSCDQGRTSEVRDGLSEQWFNSTLQTSSITESDVSPDCREVCSPTDLLSPDIVPYLSSAIPPGPENSRDSPLTTEASSTTPSYTTDSYSGISSDSPQLDRALVATGQASIPFRSSVKSCGLCQGLFNGSEQLL